MERFLLPWASAVTKPGDAGAALRCRHLASFEIPCFFAAVSEVSGVMGFPAGLAPAALQAVFSPQQAKGSGSAPWPAHPGPFAARGAEAGPGRGLLLWLVFLICQVCLIKLFLFIEQGKRLRRS